MLQTIKQLCSVRATSSSPSLAVTMFEINCSLSSLLLFMVVSCFSNLELSAFNHLETEDGIRHVLLRVKSMLEFSFRLTSNWSGELTRLYVHHTVGKPVEGGSATNDSVEEIERKRIASHSACIAMEQINDTVVNRKK